MFEATAADTRAATVEKSEGEVTWEKKPAFTGTIHHGCLNCGGTEEIAPLTMVVAVGFGVACVTRDGEDVWREQGDLDEEAFHDVAYFEALAAADPDHDWQIDLQGPMRGRTYQRHDVGKWVLIDSNAGFA